MRTRLIVGTAAVVTMLSVSEVFAGPMVISCAPDPRCLPSTGVVPGDRAARRHTASPAS